MGAHVDQTVTGTPGPFTYQLTARTSIELVPCCLKMVALQRTCSCEFSTLGTRLRTERERLLKVLLRWQLRMVSSSS
ncbi:unnamed protein product [Brassica oleracea]